MALFHIEAVITSRSELDIDKEDFLPCPHLVGETEEEEEGRQPSWTAHLWNIVAMWHLPCGRGYVDFDEEGEVDADNNDEAEITWWW